MKRITYVTISLYLFLLSWDGYLLVSDIVTFSPSFIPLALMFIIFIFQLIKDKKIHINNKIIWIFFIYIYMLLSIIWSPTNDFNGFITLISYFGSYVIIYNLIKVYKYDKRILFSYFLGVLSVGLWTYFTGNFKDLGTGRFTLVEGFNPTWFSAQIVWALIIFIFLLPKTNNLMKLIISVSSIFLIYLLLLTGGRNSLLTVVASIMLSLIISYDKNFKKILIYGLGFVFISFISYYYVNKLFGEEILNRIFDIKLIFTDQSDIATAGRTTIWSNYLKELPNYIIFGAGFYSSVDKMSITAHQIFITMFFEFGIIGLIVFSIIMFQIIKPVFNKNKKNNLSLTTLSFALIFLGLGNDSFYYKYWWTGMFIYIILIEMIETNINNNDDVEIEVNEYNIVSLN